MRIFSTGDEPGLIAVGQFAVGVIALGQVATGVIAIGQLARGVVVVGQLGIGVWAAGQIGVGVFGAAGIGIGGRGKGLVIPLVPTVEPPYDFPPCTTFDSVKAGFGDGWIDAELSLDERANVLLSVGGQRLPVKITAKLLVKARSETIAGGRAPVVAHIHRMGDALVCDRMMHVPVPITSKPGFWIGMFFRFALLIGLAVLVWAVALFPALQTAARVF